MPTKTGMGGHGSESYDPATGKFVEDGYKNVRYDNPGENRKIEEHIAPEKIEEQSASKQTAPTPNLGKYARPGRGGVGASRLRGEASEKAFVKMSADEFLRLFNELNDVRS